MTKDYGLRKVSGKKSRTAYDYFIIMLSFALGFMTASLLHIDTLSHLLSKQLLAAQDTPPKLKPKKPALQAATPAAKPKPKFEFYTLLTNEKTPAKERPAEHAETSQAATPSETATVAQAAETSKLSELHVFTKKPLNPVEPNKIKDKSAYLVQAASFKDKKDADHLKALLTLKGYVVNVTPVTNVNGNWFRVIIGPYANRFDAQKAQQQLAKTEHINGMVRNLGV